MLAIEKLGFTINPSGSSCGATVSGVDLSKPASDELIAALREAWLQYRVLAIDGQDLSMEEFERASRRFGEILKDPFIAPIPGREFVAEIRREANETSALFAEGWHSDWSFLPQPPSGTMLYGIDIPPVGGDTRFADQCAAYDALSPQMKARIANLNGVHSARRGYSPQGKYAKDSDKSSMRVLINETANETQIHPVVCKHPETGRLALFVSPGYTDCIEGMSEEESKALLKELFQHQVRDEFVYRHRWQKGTLLIWDNRSVLHAATGGYQGHRRLLWRVTVCEPQPVNAVLEKTSA